MNKTKLQVKHNTTARKVALNKKMTKTEKHLAFVKKNPNKHSPYVKHEDFGNEDRRNEKDYITGKHNN